MQSLLGYTKNLGEIFNEKGIYNKQQLKKAVKEGKIKIPNIMKLDLTYNIARRFNLETAKKIVKPYSDKDDIIPVGSYRRKKKTMKDLDILVLNGHDKELFKNSNKIVYSSGSKRKSMIIKPKWANKYYKVDLFYAKKENKPFALLHYTGDKVYNIYLRKKANEMGYKLNQYGLFKNGKKLNKNFKNEIEIINFLNAKYRTPENRNKL